MPFKFNYRQDEQSKQRQNEGLKAGGFEQLYCRPSHVLREAKRWFSDPAFQDFPASARWEELVETILLVILTMGGRVIFEVCDERGRYWMRGDGTIVFAHLVYP